MDQASKVATIVYYLILCTQTLMSAQPRAIYIHKKRGAGLAKRPRQRDPPPHGSYITNDLAHRPGKPYFWVS